MYIDMHATATCSWHKQYQRALPFLGEGTDQVMRDLGENRGSTKSKFIFQLCSTERFSADSKKWTSTLQIFLGTVVFKTSQEKSRVFRQFCLVHTCWFREWMVSSLMSLLATIYTSRTNWGWSWNNDETNSSWINTEWAKDEKTKSILQ